jgi:hypothetical protein
MTRSEPLTWYQVTAPHFCAGLGVAPDGRVAGAAPIIAWMRGKPLAGITAYCTRKGWRLAKLERAA